MILIFVVLIFIFLAAGTSVDGIVYLKRSPLAG